MTSIDVKYKILAHGKKHRFEGAFSHGLVFCAKYGWRLVSTYMLMILQRKRSTVNTDELVPLHARSRSAFVPVNRARWQNGVSYVQKLCQRHGLWRHKSPIDTAFEIWPFVTKQNKCLPAFRKACIELEEGRHWNFVQCALCNRYIQLFLYYCVWKSRPRKNTYDDQPRTESTLLVNGTFRSPRQLFLG